MHPYDRQPDTLWRDMDRRFRIVTESMFINYGDIFLGIYFSEIFLDASFTVYYKVHMKNTFGEHIRRKRESLLKQSSEFSLRQVAQRIGVEPSYLSKLERGEQTSLSEQKIVALANELGEDPDELLAMSGKISQDIQEIIRQKPKLFGELIRGLEEFPDHALLRVIREVNEGEWLGRNTPERSADLTEILAKRKKDAPYKLDES